MNYLRNFRFRREQPLSESALRVLAVIGLLSVAKVSYDCLTWTWKNVGPSVDLKRYGAGQGAFVMITGASDGIGKGIAFEAAKRGFNLILISRTRETLTDVASNIKRNNPDVEVRIVVADCSKDSSTATYEPILAATKDANVTVLVNNVGAANEGSISSAFADQNIDSITNIININCLFTSKLTAMMLPVIEQGRATLSKQKNADYRGSVIMISSFLSLVPAGYFSAYSSSKQYLNHLVECLRCELQGSKIDVNSALPAHVCSKMSTISTPSLMVPDAAEFAVSFWNKFGKDSQIIPYFPHACMGVFAGILPKWFLLKSIKDALKPKSLQ